MPGRTPKVSVIIPCLNDVDALTRCLARLNEAVGCLDFELEMIVADASQDDTCAEVAGHSGAVVVRCEARSRGQQLNAGADVATGDILLFNHADTELSAPHLLGLVAAMNVDEIIGGAFYRDLAWQYPALAWLDPWVRACTRRWGILYGDQSAFVTREAFEAMGGFAAIPIMEDVDFSDRLRKRGAIVLVDPPLRTSMRRFKKRGYLRNKLQNVCIVWMWRLRLVTPEQIYRWYYRKSPGAFTP
ncbi:MAG: glycosyltransferase [Verrucomicrobia bacterium]|nr:glycosyltransferase [Verrucomicrobiota bacterium]